MTMINPFGKQRVILTVAFLVLGIRAVVILPGLWGLLASCIFAALGLATARSENFSRWIWGRLRLP